jgi:hypothetical protein
MQQRACAEPEQLAQEIAALTSLSVKRAERALALAVQLRASSAHAPRTGHPRRRLPPTGARTRRLEAVHAPFARA